jgi:hypothetical protein
MLMIAPLRSHQLRQQAVGQGHQRGDVGVDHRGPVRQRRSVPVRCPAPVALLTSRSISPKAGGSASRRRFHRHRDRGCRRRRRAPRPCRSARPAAAGVRRGGRWRSPSSPPGRSGGQRRAPKPDVAPVIRTVRVIQATPGGKPDPHSGTVGRSLCCRIGQIRVRSPSTI